MITRRSPLQRTSRIRQVSPKRVRLNRIYHALKKRFLGEHPFCQHFIAEHGLSEAEVIAQGGLARNGLGQYFNVPPAVEIHHKRGRGKFFLDVSTWMAVRSRHSEFIHMDPERYKKGYCLLR